jgi:hypothetical protein
MKEKKAVAREYRPRYQKATKKEKRVLPGEFTRLTGYHRKSAVRVLSYKPARELTVYGHGGGSIGLRFVRQTRPPCTALYAVSVRQFGTLLLSK